MQFTTRFCKALLKARYGQSVDLQRTEMTTQKIEIKV